MSLLSVSEYAVRWTGESKRQNESIRWLEISIHMYKVLRGAAKERIFVDIYLMTSSSALGVIFVVSSIHHLILILRFLYFFMFM